MACFARHRRADAADLLYGSLLCAIALSTVRVGQESSKGHLGDVAPIYRIDTPVVEVFMHPAHAVDRMIRQSYWQGEDQSFERH